MPEPVLCVVSVRYYILIIQPVLNPFLGMFFSNFHFTTLKLALSHIFLFFDSSVCYLPVGWFLSKLSLISIPLGTLLNFFQNSLGIQSHNNWVAIKSCSFDWIRDDFRAHPPFPTLESIKHQQWYRVSKTMMRVSANRGGWIGGDG